MFHERHGRPVLQLGQEVVRELEFVAPKRALEEILFERVPQTEMPARLLKDSLSTNEGRVGASES